MTDQFGTIGVMSEPVRQRGLREIRNVLRGATPTHEHLRSRVSFVLGATLLLDAVASVFVLLFERHASGTQVQQLR
jgi:hypothetical protein